MDPVKINLSEAKAHLGRYVAEAAAGKVFLVCERNEPMAELRPIASKEHPTPRPIQMGWLEGKVEVPDNFNDPLPEFEAEFYGVDKKEPWDPL
jgi:antitoxin (DNA-binding transcriptional repressor) of toxin-antitoxin stability system